MRHSVSARPSFSIQPLLSFLLGICIVLVIALATLTIYGYTIIQRQNRTILELQQRVAGCTEVMSFGAGRAVICPELPASLMKQ